LSLLFYFICPLGFNGIEGQIFYRNNGVKL
jgi:hypothetical protein